MENSTKISAFPKAIDKNQENIRLSVDLDTEDSAKLEAIQKFHNYKKKSDVIRDLIRTYYTNVIDSKKRVQ